MSKVPAIRFEGFTDPWEQRKLGNVVSEFYCGQTPYRHNDSYWQGSVNWLASGDLNRGLVTKTEERITELGRNSTGLRLVPKGTVVVATMGQEAPGTRGNCGILGIESTINQACMALFVDEAVIDNAFLFQWYKAVGNAYGLKYTQGTKQQNYNADTLGSLDIGVPSITEQHRIGSLFSSLDNLITLHQRKYDQLVVLKKALLDKMFPQPGASEPEIRFEGFTDPWEQRKLGELAEIVGGGTPDTNNPDYWDGDIDWYSPAELGGQIYADASQRRITREGYESSSAKMLPAGKTILFTSRAGIGTTAILRRSACTNQGFQSLVLGDEVDVYFVYSMSGRVKAYAESKASGSTFLEISGKQLAEMELMLPNRDEQNAVGGFFLQLDNLITLHQRKLELLRNLKSALLNKLFV